MSNSYEEKYKKEWENFSKKKINPNIMLLGVTGCGKSSLINLVFGKDIAPVNDISRGTKGFNKYSGKKYGISVNLIDSRGYEMENGSNESFEEYKKSIQVEMQKSEQSGAENKIHIIWFCISVAAERIQDYDIEVLKLLLSNQELKKRVAVILTKCDEDDEDGGTASTFKDIIRSEVDSQIDIFETSTDKNLTLELMELIKWSSEQLGDDDLKEAFISSQMIDLDMKRLEVNSKIKYYAGAAAAIGATPVPVSDAALLTPLQITMSANIIYLYGMENLTSISSALLGNIVISNLGKSIVGGILKFIPGVGTLVGGVINAGVASLITSGLGYAISEICYDSCKKIAKGEYVDLSKLFDFDSISKLTNEYIKKNK